MDDDRFEKVLAVFRQNRDIQSSASMNDDHFQKVFAVIRQNRRLTVREVNEEVGICKSSCHLILTGKKKKHGRCVVLAQKFAPPLLTRHFLYMNF
jgi:predicted transcriptional regulator